MVVLSTSSRFSCKGYFFCCLITVVISAVWTCHQKAHIMATGNEAEVAADEVLMRVAVHRKKSQNDCVAH